MTVLKQSNCLGTIKMLEIGTLQHRRVQSHWTWGWELTPSFWSSMRVCCPEGDDGRCCHWQHPLPGSSWAKEGASLQSGLLWSFINRSFWGHVLSPYLPHPLLTSSVHCLCYAGSLSVMPSTPSPGHKGMVSDAFHSHSLLSWQIFQTIYLDMLNLASSNLP